MLPEYPASLSTLNRSAVILRVLSVAFLSPGELASAKKVKKLATVSGSFMDSFRNLFVGS